MVGMGTSQTLIAGPVLTRNEWALLADIEAQGAVAAGEAISYPVQAAADRIGCSARTVHTAVRVLAAE